MCSLPVPEAWFCFEKKPSQWLLGTVSSHDGEAGFGEFLRKAKGKAFLINSLKEAGKGFLQGDAPSRFCTCRVGNKVSLKIRPIRSNPRNWLVVDGRSLPVSLVPGSAAPGRGVRGAAVGARLCTPLWAFAVRNTPPRTGLPQTTETHSLLALEARSPRWRCQRAVLPPAFYSVPPFCLADEKQISCKALPLDWGPPSDGLILSLT